MQAEQPKSVTQIGLPDLTGTLYALCEAPVGKDGLPGVTPRMGRPLVSYGGVVNRLWEVIFSIVEFLRGDSGYRRRILAESLQKCSVSFRAVVDDLTEAHQRYQEYLEDAEGKRPVVAAEVAEARAKICHWSNHIQVPDGMSLKDMFTKANSAFGKLVADAKKQGVELSGAHKTLVDYQSVFEAIRRDQLLIDFEHDLHTPIPFGILRKLCQKKVDLSVVEKDALNQWIEKVNDCWKLNARRLHRGLAALVEYLGHRDISPSTLPSPLHVLERRLVKMGLKALSQTDFTHLRWRQQVSDTHTVSANGKTYVLGDKIGDSPKGRLDNRQVFTLEKDSAHVLVIAANEALLGLAVAEAHVTAEPIPLATVKEIHANGRFALIERLQKPVEGYQWDMESDRATLESLKEMLCRLARMQKTPHVSIGQLMFDRQDAVKMTRKAVPGERFDFDRIVKLAYKCANGDYEVFRYLLKESGLCKHRVVKYYSDVVHDAFATKSVGVDKVAARQKPSISDAFVRRQARHLSKEVLAMADRCYHELVMRYSLPEGMKPKEVKGKIAKMVIHHYTKSIGAGILWPGLQGSVVHSVAKKMDLTAKPKNGS